METDVAKLLDELGVETKDRGVFQEAFTHKSYSCERGLDYDNQRLEFLGDAVLQIAITEYLYERYPEEKEGRLTKMRSAIARQSSLAELARELDLGAYVRLGRGERANGGADRVSTLCDVFEAFIGALYLNRGLTQVEKILLPLFRHRFPKPDALIEDMNPKGMLQELTQCHYPSERPEYVVESKEGPDHDCVYSVTVLICGKTVGRGSGKSRKSAEMSAAAAAIEELKEAFHP
jgi:ribonuclease-3